ncbi:MAG: hypothetical protein AB2L14_04905 [Candidatus Xenobiia bacterium LiM19]
MSTINSAMSAYGYPTTKPHLVTKGKDGSLIVGNPNGRNVQVNGSTVNINTPSGTTSIWGDPHVTEADGDQWNWTTDTATFQNQNGFVKMTMEADGSDGAVQSTDIYLGKRTQVHIDNTTGEYEVIRGSQAKLNEQNQDDGQTYITNDGGKTWVIAGIEG